MNYDSRIVECQEGKTGWKYYYIVRPKFSRDQELVNIEVFTTTGKMETYTVAEKYKLNGRRVKQDGTIKGKLRDSAQMINPTFEYQQLVKMQLNEDNEITEIQTVTKSTGVDSGYSKDHIRRSEAKKTYKIWDDSRGVLCAESSSELGRYFMPKIYFTVPSAEKTDRNCFETTLIKTNSTVLLDLYDVDDLTPNVAVRYKDIATDAEIKVGYANGSAAVMLDRRWVALNEEDEVVLKIILAQQGAKKEYFSYDLNILDGYEQGDLLRIYGYEDEITKIEPILYNGKVVGPNNLPSIGSTDPISLDNFPGTKKKYAMQVYKVINENDFIVQNGPIVNGFVREQQCTCCIRNKEWQGGGVLVYNYIGGKERAEVRQGTIADLRSVVADGMSNASIVLFSSHDGGAIQLIIYNLE